MSSPAPQPQPPTPTGGCHQWLGWTKHPPRVQAPTSLPVQVWGVGQGQVPMVGGNIPPAATRSCSLRLCHFSTYWQMKVDPPCHMKPASPPHPKTQVSKPWGGRRQGSPFLLWPSSQHGKKLGQTSLCCISWLWLSGGLGAGVVEWSHPPPHYVDQLTPY